MNAPSIVDIMSQSELTITIYVGDIVGYIIGDIVRNGDLPEQGIKIANNIPMDITLNYFKQKLGVW